MNYSSIPFLALAIHCIVNHTVIKNVHYRKNTRSGRSFRGLILSMIAFFASDCLWGLLYDADITGPVYVDTVVYSVLMMGTVFHWTRFVSLYFRDRGMDCSLLQFAGSLFVFFGAVSLVLNFFVPVLFRFDEAGTYHMEWLSIAAHVYKIVLFLAGAFSVLMARRGNPDSKNLPHAAVGISGVVMAGMVVLQILHPLLPFYSMACILGSCILHTFVVEELKEDRRLELEDLLRREEEKEQELGSAKVLAYTDPLTGVKNTLAYADFEDETNEQIAKGVLKDFGLVVFDLNNLKKTNDTKGHEAGDDLLKEASHTICDHFKRSPVFRVGGDEFVAVLEGEDYRNRYALLEAFNRRIEANLHTGGAVVASGLSVFRPGEDGSCRQVFERADRRMYGRKSVLKAMKV